ncbi:MAG TPA: CapA family protein [Spirochaetia bacterium]|nr:CapA family protein [Spirochaetia bacterium]
MTLILLLASLVTVQSAEPAPDRVNGSPSRPPLVLSFVGDIMHHEINAAMPDFDRLYDSVRALLQIDDLSFANVEFPVDPAREPSGYPIFNGSVDYLEAAIRAGFDVLSLANNHSFDLGAGGVATTKAVVDDLARRGGIHASGLRSEPWAPIEVTAIDHRTWRIGFVAVTSFSNVAGSSPYINLINYFDRDVRRDFLASVRQWSEEYDLLILSVHAGDEYVSTPVTHKSRFLRELSDAGAHIVWSHHPHVLQPWEQRDGRVIIFSAGNFVSGQRRYQSPLVPFGRWAPTGDTAIYQLAVSQVGDLVEARMARTPLFTMLAHPEHGLVLRSYDEVLANDGPMLWRAFHLARYPVMRRFVTRELRDYRVAFVR